MERSTFRRDTSSGTCRTVGAKLRMLLTPAETSRSAASWAAAAVVATMPIEISRSFTIRSRSAKSSTTIESTGFPILVSSMSTSALTRKPRSPKPR